MSRMACLIFVTWLLIITFSPPVKAESLAVSLKVGFTQVEFSGYTSPNAFITVTQDLAVVGTTVADSTGYWIKLIDADNPGIQSFELTSNDLSGFTTPLITYTPNLVGNTTTSIGNIVFPPTITSSSLPTYPGENLTLTGFTHPSATLTVISSDWGTDTLTVSLDGSWTYTKPVGTTTGTYSLYLSATMTGGYLSLPSETISYILTSPSSSPTPTPSSSNSSDTSTSLSSSPSPSPSTSLSTTLVDLFTRLPSTQTTLPLPIITLLKSISPTHPPSISSLDIIEVIKSWIFASQKYLPDQCDYDKDTICNLTDLSILLYYVGR